MENKRDFKLAALVARQLIVMREMGVDAEFTRDELDNLAQCYEDLDWRMRELQK